MKGNSEAVLGALNTQMNFLKGEEVHPLPEKGTESLNLRLYNFTQIILNEFNLNKIQ